MAAINISRLSLSYDVQEDRLRMAVCDAGERTLGLWLTRRLAMGVVAMMRGCLEGSSAVAGRTLPNLKASVMAIEHVALSARRKGEDGSPVRVQEPGIVVTGVNLRRKGRGYALIFFAADQELAFMRLDHRMLHRFAGALAAKMQDASWTTGFDPDWLGKKGAATAGSGRKKRMTWGQS
jgi:hypothetical protein